ncbi:hypothetical protein AMTR_s00045p00167420 [Amborella trichopoda]|uniref:Uncharacterized protein n=2 Tax=Amborella trichopoda TaxID=13333 RepID=W1P391_AMBTC|nr:hypothetical protein AMTR_s00045p00167420 [Amborella trichopoda]
MDVTFTKLGFHEPETLSGLLMAFQAPEEQSKSTGSSSPINTPPISGTLNDQGKVPIADILEQTDHGTYPKKETAYPISLASLEILNSYSNLSRRLSGSSAVKQSTHVDPPIGGEKKLSTEEVMRIAGEQYLTTGENLSSPSIRDSSKLSHLTKEDVKNIELANLLLSSAEKISNQQYDRAKRLLMVCDFESSPVGNPVQRLVFHFADALWERAERETGMKSLKPEYIEREADVDKALRGYHPVVLAIYQAVPFGKLVQFTASQVIIGALDSATKIHVIDLEPRTGMQWTILMQSLSERSEYPVEHLKITMVGDSTGKMEETDVEESVAVLAPMVLRTMLVKPHCLEKMIRVIRNLCPDIMVLTEVEGKHNSPSFVNRFIEVLFYYSAYFDSLDAFMEAADPNRLAMEGTLMASAVRNMIAREGGERIMRHVGLDTWRLFLNRVGFEEVEVSEDALYQAKLIVKSYNHAESVSLEMNGKSLTIGWKGTPLHSVSAWRCF